MMKQEYVILRDAAPADLFVLRSARVAVPTIHVSTLDGRGFVDAACDQSISAIAPNLPLRLIEPTRLGTPTVIEEDDEPWGLVAVRALDCPYSGASIRVAVLDTGLDEGHSAFAGIRIVKRDFTGEGNGDDNGHGTHCAGTIFGRNFQGKRIGIARGVSEAIVGKVLSRDGSGSIASLCQGLLWAIEQRAHVISMSIGIDYGSYARRLVSIDGFPEDVAMSKALEGYRATLLLFEKLAAFMSTLGSFGEGAIVIAATGNESRRDMDPDFEVYAGPPAASGGVIAVGSLARSGQAYDLAAYSNLGASVGAPGHQIVSAAAGAGLAVMSGTSMAVPHVAGVAALWAEKLLSETHRCTPEDLRQHLLGSATRQKLSSVAARPAATGVGLVRAPVAAK